MWKKPVSLMSEGCNRQEIILFFSKKKNKKFACVDWLSWCNVCFTKSDGYHQFCRATEAEQSSEGHTVRWENQCS